APIRSNVRFGSKADIEARPHHVRFTLKSRHQPNEPNVRTLSALPLKAEISRIHLRCPLCAKKRTLAHLFDHLVGGSEQSRGQTKAKRFGHHAYLNEAQRIAANEARRIAAKFCQIARTITLKAAFIRTLPSRWVMGGNACLAHFYYAFRTVFLRRCYHQILGPRRRLPEFANGFCRHRNARLHLDPHMTWQAAKSYV